MQSIYKNEKKHVCIIFTDLTGKTTLEMFFFKSLRPVFLGGCPYCPGMTLFWARDLYKNIKYCKLV